jgi:hypothetical protein
MKYKIEFSGKAEILFAVMAKLLPDELNVHVEEIFEAPPVQQSKIAKLVSESKAITQVVKPNKKHDKRHVPFKHPSGKGSKEFIMEFLKEKNRPTNWAEMGAYIESLGYSKSSVNNAISRLIESKNIEKAGSGIYQLIHKKGM